MSPGPLPDPAVVPALLLGGVIGSMVAAVAYSVLLPLAQSDPIRRAWRAYRELFADIWRLLLTGRWT